MPNKKEDKIYSVLTSIDLSLKKQNSTGRVFIQGLTRGFATALGATVLVTLVTSVAFQFSSRISLESFSEYFFNETIQD